MITRRFWCSVVLIVCLHAALVKTCNRSSDKKGEDQGPSVLSCCKDFLKSEAVGAELTRAREDSVSYAQCVFHREGGCLMCDSPTGTAHCCTVASTVQDDSHHSGPVPRGEYLMSQVTQHSMYDIDWIKLLPKKVGKEDYWSYETPNEIGRAFMSLHPGCLARSSVTVDTCALNSQNDGQCWDRISDVIQGGAIVHEGVIYTGTLRVV